MDLLNVREYDMITHNSQFCKKSSWDFKLGNAMICLNVSVYVL